MLGEIGSSEVPRLLVMNKVDLLDAPAQGAPRGPRARRRLRLGAQRRGSRRPARGASTPSSSVRSCAVRLLVPYDQGAVIDRLHGVATDIRQESTAEGTLIDARLPLREANRYAALRIDLPAADADDDDDGAAERPRRGVEAVG